MKIKHFHFGSVGIHPWLNRTTYDSETQSDKESDTSSIEQDQSFTVHSVHPIMDYQYTSVPTVSPPCNTKDAAIIPSRLHPRCSKTHPTQLPRPSNVTNNNACNPKPDVRKCQQSAQKKTQSGMIRKLPLLPTPPAPVRSQIRKQDLARPPPCSDN